MSLWEWVLKNSFNCLSFKQKNMFYLKLSVVKCNSSPFRKCRTSGQHWLRKMPKIISQQITRCSRGNWNISFDLSKLSHSRSPRLFRLMATKSFFEFSSYILSFTCFIAFYSTMFKSRPAIKLFFIPHAVRLSLMWCYLRLKWATKKMRCDNASLEFKANNLAYWWSSLAWNHGLDTIIASFS